MKFFLMSFLLSTSVLAETFKLAVITSEFDKNKTDYYLETDEIGEIDSMRYVTTTPSGAITEDVTLPAERVMKEGAVLVERNGYEAVRLEVENFSLKTGGILKLNYLYSAVSGTRSIKRLNVSQKDGRFGLFDAQTEINRLFLKANWNRLFGIVGIKEILTSFQSKK